MGWRQQRVLAWLVTGVLHVPLYVVPNQDMNGAGRGEGSTTERIGRAGCCISSRLGAAL